MAKKTIKKVEVVEEPIKEVEVVKEEPKKKRVMSKEQLEHLARIRELASAKKKRIKRTRFKSKKC